MPGPFAEHEADGDRRIQVAAWHMTNRVEHRHDGQAERHRYPVHPDADLREGGSQHRAPAAGEHDPEHANSFCCQSIHHVVSSTDSVALTRTMPVGSKRRKQRDAHGQGKSVLRLVAGVGRGREAAGDERSRDLAQVFARGLGVGCRAP